MKDFIKSTSKIKSLPVLLSIFLFCSISVFGQFAQMGSKIVGTGGTGTLKQFQGLASAISADGKIIAFGSYTYNNGSGIVWVYRFNGSTWEQLGNNLVGDGAANNKSSGGFGSSLSLSASGDILAVGGPGYNSGVGAVWVYTFSGGNWIQIGPKLEGTGGINIYYGKSVKLSDSGTLLAVSAEENNFNTNTYNKPVWIYTLSGTNWNQMGNKLIGINTISGSSGAMEIKSIGLTEDLLVTGGGNSIYLFSRVGSTWSQVHNPIEGIGGPAGSAATIELSSNGKVLAIGYSNDSNSLGSVKTYKISKTGWTQLGGKLFPSQFAYISYTFFGAGISLSNNGSIMAVSGHSDSASVGAIWLYTLSGSNWIQTQRKIVPNDGNNQSNFGWSLVLSANGKALIAGGPNDNDGMGAVWVFTAPGWDTDTVATDDGTPTPISSDTLSISGTVHQGSGVLTDGIVMAIEKTTNASKILRVTNGNFRLDSLKRGEYMLYAVPNPVTVTNYLPTFYVNKVKLKDAITLSLRGHIRSVDIYLVPLPSTLTGTHTITGRFSYESSSSADPAAFTSHWFSQNNKTATEIPITTQPCRQMPVLLLNAQNAVLKSVVTDSSGYFIVKNIPAGTYKLLGQRNGYASKNEGTVTVSTSTTEVANLRMEAVVTAFDDLDELSKSSPIVFPNPFQKTFEVKGYTGDLTVYAITGKVVYQNFHNENEAISTETWPAGFYFLKMGEKIEKLIKQD